MWCALGPVAPQNLGSTKLSYSPRQSGGKGWSIERKWYKMSTYQEIHPEFEISPEVKSVDIHAFEGFYPLHHSGVAAK